MNEIKENDSYVGAVGQSRELVRWVYAHDKGDISEPFEVGEKYIVAIETIINKPGLPDVSVLRPQVESLARNEKKAKQIIDSKFKGASLEAISQSTGTPVTKADSLSFTNAFIPGLGMESKVIGAAFNKNLKGKVSDAIAGSSGVYAIRVENIGAKSTTTDEQTLKQTLLQQQRSAFYRGGDALRKAASIKDYRSKFY